MEATLHIEVVRSIDTRVSPFIESQIGVVAKNLEKLSTNLAHETRSGLWSTYCEVEGHTKEFFPQIFVCSIMVNYEIFQG